MATLNGGGERRETPNAGKEHRDNHSLEWKGAHPGDQFVRLARHRAFKRLGTGRYEIRAKPWLFCPQMRCHQWPTPPKKSCASYSWQAPPH